MSANRLRQVIRLRRHGIPTPVSKQDIIGYLAEMLEEAKDPYMFASNPADMPRVEIRDVVFWMLKRMELLVTPEITGVAPVNGNVISLEAKAIETSKKQLKDLLDTKGRLIDEELKEVEQAHLRLAAVNMELARRFYCLQSDKTDERTKEYNIFASAIEYLAWDYDAQETTKPAG